MRKIAAVLGIIVIFCTACGKVDSQSIQNNTYENTTDEEITKFDLYDGRIDVDNSYDGIAGGFYICDENKQPILNNQIIESDSDMKFYMKVANPGTKKINYAISVIINDCYQNLNVIKKDGNKDPFANGSLESGQAEALELEFKLQQYQGYAGEDRVINFIMTYYEPVEPADELTLVPIAVANEKHQIKYKDKDYTVADDNVIEYSANGMESNDSGYWILDDTNDNKLLYNFILDSNNTEKAVVINQSENNGYAVIFEDDKPVKINNGYLFRWKQKHGELFKINIKDVKGRFLYFYEYTEDEDIVVSPLYYNK